MWSSILSLVSVATLFSGALSQLCSANSRYKLNTPSGWQAGVALSSLRSPRGLTLDTEGHLLVVQRGMGVSAHTLGADGCVTASKTVISQSDLNHGIAVSADGKMLYASSTQEVFSWSYDPVAMTVSNKKSLINGMPGQDHISRTLHIPSRHQDILVVSRGSTNNIDSPTEKPETGRAIVKVFNLTQLQSGSAVNYASGGKVFGYGLRNDVGLAEDKAGNIWSVENSGDNIQRNGVDVHNDNPGEPMFNLGDPANPSGFFGGYPHCFLVFSPSLFRSESMTVGQWFVQRNNGTITDAWCNSNAKKPALLLPPHSAPLDIKFGVGSDTAAYVGLHGSWNRQPPQGYRVVRVPGKYDATGNWAPDAPLSSSPTAYSNILSNTNEGSCTTGCFRPVGLQWDPKGNFLYVASDTSGEVIILKKTA